MIHLPKIDESLFLHNVQTTRTPSPELGKEEFLKILIAQLQYQDPLNPMEDKEFIAQMANFSSLEQMMNISRSMDTLVQSQLISPVIQYSHMIGKIVTYEGVDETSGVADSKSSKVISVTQDNGWAILELENGDQVYADAITHVREASEVEE